jgi:hypothetical protein
VWKRCAGSLTTVKSDKRGHGWAVSVFNDGSGSTSAPAWLIGAWQAPFLRGLQPAPLQLTFFRSDRPRLRVGTQQRELWRERRPVARHYSVARLMDRCARCCAGQEHPRFFASTKPMVMRVSTMFASSSRATMRIGLVMAGA